MAELNKKYLPVFKSIPEVKLAYFFGSRATGDDGPASDYDFAVYLDEHDAKKIRYAEWTSYACCNCYLGSYYFEFCRHFRPSPCLSDKDFK